MRVELVFAAAAAAATACFAGALAACAPAGPPVAPEFAHVAAFHRSHCGQCHVRVEPGQRTRAELEVALARHRDRVHLSEDDWNLMVDYLAQDKPPAPATP